MENLFAYGTLQDKNVQRDIFKRLLEGEADALIGYSLSKIKIGDGVYPCAVFKSSGRMYGVVYTLSLEELKRADEYEGVEYRRVKLKLHSGLESWVYVCA